MPQSRFTYVTYIRATPQAVWDGLTKPEFTRRYWAGTTQKSDWTAGAAWGAYTPDGRLWDVGEVLAVEPRVRLTLSWRNEGFPEMTAEGFTRVTYALEPVEDATMLTFTQESDLADSQLVAAMSQGWPAVLASLKSLLETGEPLAFTTRWPEGL